MDRWRVLAPAFARRTQTGEPTMAQITAQLVNELRARSGQGMMECKKALNETAGDIEKAVEWFRKKGVKTSVLSREAKEGRVTVKLAADAKSGIIVEINCNTDFTAKSEPVAKLADIAADLLLKDGAAKVADDAKVKELLTQTSQQTGENIVIGRTAAISSPSGKLSAYSHYTGKVGVLVALSGNGSEELAKDLCLHITALRPLAMTREQVPAAVVAKEREIAVEQAKATGKPQNIAEKIAEGKMRTFYEERVLLDQKFVKDDSKTIAQLLQSAGAKLENYVRIEVGQ
jgi:elongation factor Ts